MTGGSAPVSVLAAALACVRGAVETTADDAGVTFQRVPAAARARIADPTLDLMSAVPSGVRLEVLTDATVLELDADLTHLVPMGEESPGTALDLVVDGMLRAPVHAGRETVVHIDYRTRETRVSPAGPATLRFELGPPGPERRVEVWFPVASAMKLLDIRIPEGASLRPAPPTGPLWVHHGSSISQCSEADRPTGSWPAAVARAAGVSLVNLGLGGQCHLDQFMARTIRDLPAAAISLELGINVVNFDSMRERAFVSAFHGFLDTVRDGHPATPLLIVTPIHCPAAEDRPGPTPYGPDGRFTALERPAESSRGCLTLTRVRELLRAQVDLRRAEGDTALQLLDGTDLFGPADAADLPDGLHPNTAGYHRMATRFLPRAFGDRGALRGPPLSLLHSRKRVDGTEASL
ncbi:lipase [Streptomyces sp. TRM66268-LWL]|uniref:Lipase n=1 Tax=Streptomyces polyasparticus TaxID=2767826 RepID=A0ABR7S6H4_9ACTN|nr:SGNH/GDSL hydrolase family protein [Streptomyces polyasparticus]MBC9711091.1 lipase [Streptomyces polyasparticus]